MNLTSTSRSQHHLLRNSFPPEKSKKSRPTTRAPWTTHHTHLWSVKVVGHRRRAFPFWPTFTANQESHLAHGPRTRDHGDTNKCLFSPSPPALMRGGEEKNTCPGTLPGDDDGRAVITDMLLVLSWLQKGPTIFWTNDGNLFFFRFGW